ncbi:GNAT family N-acetyltransferase [Chloroflexi bacterium TSY]|nr:GNAT family N-acetyltransferase [Chloroflexi bacterium TSY]
MNDSLTIRSARPDDAEVLIMIRREAILILATEKMGNNCAHDWANSAAPNRVQQAIAEHQVSVAEIAEQPVGWVEVEGNRIEGLYIQPEQARQGIGSALLAHAEEQIRSAGYPSAALDASWNAEQFYIDRGYQPQLEGSPDSGRPMLKPLTSDIQ